MKTPHLITDDGDTSLSTRAPGLFRDLGKILTAPGLTLAQRAFARAYNGSKEYELQLVRPPEANYNTRAARVPQILINELGEQDLTTLLASILAAGTPVAAPHNSPSETNGELNEAEFLAQQALAGKVASESSERIWLALVLDDLRHLHMHRLTLPEKQNKLALLKVRVADLIFPSNQRIHSLAKAGVDRLERIIGGQDE